MLQHISTLSEVFQKCMEQLGLPVVYDVLVWGYTPYMSMTNASWMRHGQNKIYGSQT